MEIAAQIDAAVNQVAHLGNRVCQQPWSDSIVPIGHTIFEHVDWFTKLGHVLHDGGDGTRSYFRKGHTDGLIALRWQPRHALRYGVALTALTAVPLLVLAHAPSALVLAVTMLADGIAIEQFGVAWDVSLQQNVPADRLARVYSYDAVGSFVAIPVGQMLVGPIAGQVGVEATLTGAAVLVVLATLAALVSGSVRGLQRSDVTAMADVVSGPHAPWQHRPDEPGHQPAEV